jgi:bacillithiol biosynthesis cysteine-adding enzyme BshC
MTATCIPFTQVPHSTALLTDYLYHYDRIRQFYNGSPYEASSYQRVAGQLRDFATPRQELADILERQNRAFGCAEPTLANIGKLRDPGTFAVVTGQQVGLFSGPAFTLFKALSTVRLARSLSEQGLPSVPVFWLATQDHDLAEVAEAATFDEEYNRIPLRDSGDRPSAKSPVGLVRHTAEITTALDQLEAVLPAGEPRIKLLQDLRECYEPGSTWGQSFAKFMTRLFGRFGVILIDPLDESVNRLSTGIYERVLDSTPQLRTQLLERSRTIVSRGYHAQVHVGEDSTLVFASRNGDRVPLQERHGKWSIDGAENVSLAALRSSLVEHPLDFSPNALLRPLVQDTLLPTLAYVAGPSELAYLGQSQVLYQAFERPQPVLFPRAAFTLVDARTERLMEKYKLSVADVWQGEEHLGNKIAAVGLAEGWSERFDQGERNLDELLERLHQDIEKLDPTLLATLEHTKEKMKYQMERLRGKISRAALGRSDLLARHAQALQRFLMPHKDLQERRVSGVYFLGRSGYELLDNLLAHIQVRCSDHLVIKY